MIFPSDWAALCARSETDRPHEWIPVLTVIRNRVESSRYPDSYRDVVLQPWQFSYFNTWRERTDYEAIFEEARAGYAGDDSGDPENNYAEAQNAATWVEFAPRWKLPFGPAVFNFWSPVSMKPRGSLPRWNWEDLRVFELPGIDGDRFKFAETIR